MLRQRILVVDDTSEVLTLMCKILRSEGYRILEASSGAGAIAVCEQVSGNIDLLLTDVKMPGMNGIELAEKLCGAYPAIRVLLISGQCEESEIRDQVTVKHHGFLSKPFMPRMLIDAVGEILKPAKRPPAIVKSGLTPNRRSASP